MEAEDYTEVFPSASLPPTYLIFLCILNLHRRFIQDLHKLLTGDRLMLIQILGNLMELSDIICKDLRSLFMLPSYKLHNLLVQKCLRLKGTG